jgi:hypothetical protein
MQQVGQQLRAAGVAAVYLSHGTFAGDDAAGLIGELGRLFPAASAVLRRVIKEMIDAAAGDVGNYSGGYAQLFEEAINADGESFIPVRRFNWSSENHHIGRADGAVRLIDELGQLELEPGARVLLWGHSHAGNVFALMSNLLGGDAAKIEEFFAAARIYYQWPLLGLIDIPIWRSVSERLLAGTKPIAPDALDIVTFGTPIRYGWDADGHGRLMHFINHRPADGLPAYRAPFPPKLERVLEAVDGDYVQQFGIAGTNFMPSLFAWRCWLADQRLNRLLQPKQQTYDMLERFRVGARVPEAGTTLLVDYGRQQGNLAQHFAGHAVYTQPEWLLFHAEEVVHRYYDQDHTEHNGTAA